MGFAQVAGPCRNARLERQQPDMTRCLPKSSTRSKADVCKSYRGRRKNRQRQIGSHLTGPPMKKPVLSIDEPEQKKAPRADRPPTEGFVVVVDGHFKSEFNTVDAASAADRKLKSTYPMLQIEIYDAATKARTLLSKET